MCHAKDSFPHLELLTTKPWGNRLFSRQQWYSSFWHLIILLQPTLVYATLGSQYWLSIVPKDGICPGLWFFWLIVFRIKTQQNGLIWVQCLLMKLQLNSPGLHFHVHQYLASYQTLQVKKKNYLTKEAILGRTDQGSLLQKLECLLKWLLKLKLRGF